ncbi:MAG: LodA/GoxA family CTQ-dependent oxidase [Gammaproteobacteria bacterium]
MTEGVPMTRYERVQEILDRAAGSSAADYGGLGSFWHLPLPRLLELVIHGVRMIAPEGEAKAACCHGESAEAGERQPRYPGRGAASGLVRGLRGQPPFDGEGLPRGRMPTAYRIHPGIGIARLGNSPDAFCLSPEEPAVLPLACDEHGNPLPSPDGSGELRIKNFKDAEGRVKRQAARFQVWAYDDDSPQGRPLKIGDPVEGGGNAGVLVDIQWRVYLANKKASWYEFAQLDGEHGYGPGHARRNAGITDPEARQRLIIDPGPRSIDCTKNRRAHFGRDGGDAYAAAFPPPPQPEPIESLGDLLTDDAGRLLVLGGHGRSGSYRFDELGQPRIDDYANNDGWFDDTSDGPVMARLVMYSPLVERTRFVDVEYPAYVPEILDVVTMDDVLADLAVREFAERTDLYGTGGTFGDSQHIPPTDQEAPSDPAGRPAG